MPVTQNVSIINDPRIISGLINQVPIDEGYLWRTLAQIELTTGLKWKSRSNTVRAVMAKLLDVSEKLPFLMKGSAQDREGGFIKLGGSIAIEPEELIGYDATGQISAELKRIALSLRTGIEGAIEWITLRGLTGQTLVLDSGVAANMGAVGSAVTTGTVWTNIAATGIADLITMMGVSRGLNDAMDPSAIIMSRTAWGNLRNQTATQSMVFSTAGAGTVVSDEQLKNLLVTSGLPPIIIYDGMVEVENGITFTATRVLPVDIVAMLPSQRKFPEGFARMFVTRLSDQIVNANKGLVDPQLDGDNFIYGWVTERTNPGGHDVNGYSGAGFDLEATSRVCTLDVTP